jgi:hypothetical protein
LQAKETRPDAPPQSAFAALGRCHCRSAKPKIGCGGRTS